jgi:hypothetical protein
VKVGSCQEGNWQSGRRREEKVLMTTCLGKEVMEKDFWLSWSQKIGDEKFSVYHVVRR